MGVVGTTFCQVDIDRDYDLSLPIMKSLAAKARAINAEVYSMIIAKYSETFIYYSYVRIVYKHTFARHSIFGKVKL